MLRSGPLVLEMDRPGEGLFQVSMNDGPLLGLTLRSVDGLLIIHKVRKMSPGHLAGVRMGDRIVSVNDDGGFAMKSVSEATEALMAILSDPPHYVVLKVLRAPRVKGTDEDEDDDDDDNKTEEDKSQDLSKLFTSKGSLRFNLSDEPEEKVKMKVPKGAKPGDTVEMKVNGRTVQLVIPKGAKPGKTVQVVIPRKRTAADEAKDAYLAAKALTDEKNAAAEAEAKAEAEKKKAAEAALEKKATAPAGEDKGLLSGFTNMFGGEPANADNSSAGFASMFASGGAKAPTPIIVAKGLKPGVETENVKVRVPVGVKTGDLVEFQLPGDRTAKVVIPEGANPGDVIKVQVAKKKSDELQEEEEVQEEEQEVQEEVEEVPPPVPAPKSTPATKSTPAPVPVPAPAPKAKQASEPVPGPAAKSGKKYDVVFKEGKLGISLNEGIDGQLPSVDENTNAGQKFPASGDILTAVNGSDLSGEEDPYNAAIEMISSSGRPLTLTFISQSGEVPSPVKSTPPNTASVAPKKKEEEAPPSVPPPAPVPAPAPTASASSPPGAKPVAATPPSQASKPASKPADKPAEKGGWGTTATSGSTAPSQITKSSDDTGNAILGMFGMEVRDDKEAARDPSAAEEPSMFGQMVGGLFGDDASKASTNKSTEGTTEKPKDSSFFGGFGF
jgi:hypothetical protein